MMSARSTVPEPNQTQEGVTVAHDMAVGPIRVVILDGSGQLTDSARECVRVRGVDLRQVASRTAWARETHPGLDVLVDIDVVIDTSAAGARHRMTSEHSPPRLDTLLYVGTSAGLAGLIADIHALGICDGAALRPLLPGIVELIRKQVLPELDAIGRGQQPAHQWSTP